MNEWTKYKVIPGAGADPVTNECTPLNDIAHVTHIEPALRTLADSRIKAGLVYDESRLRTERISVVWLSPNYWHPGFRYGNVSFQFDWQKLVNDKKFFWIEAIHSYSPVALRILLSDRDHSSRFPIYDPVKGDGPWWLDQSSGSHYWNGKYTLEIMIEGDLEIEDCYSVNFVNHHARLCNISPNDCAYKGLTGLDASCYFLAQAVSRRVNLTKLTEGNLDPFTAFGQAYSFLRDKLIKLSEGSKFNGFLTGRDIASRSVARAILSAYSSGDSEELARLIELYESPNAMTEAYIRVLCRELKVARKTFSSVYEPEILE